MSLFQPTNITPDVLNGVGNGTVDVTQDLYVAWQVNGNSPMTAWRIQIYPNTASGTALLTRNGTLSEPFYGVDYDGNVQMFSTTIPQSALSSAGITNGNEYKMIITQYWAASSYIVQRSASVFRTRSTPTVTITNAQALNTCDYTFKAQFTQSQGDAVAWARWTIANMEDVDNPFYDTGKIYTQDLQCYYDGFLKGNTYKISVEVETINGISASASSVVTANWATSSLPGRAWATRINSQSSAVCVSWDGFRYIQPTVTGDYTMDGGLLTLPSGSNVLWNQVNGEAMSLGTPWYMLYCTTLSGASANLVTLTNGASTGNIQLIYDYPNRALSLTINGSTVASLASVRSDETLWVILTNNALYIRRYGRFNALVPSESQTPGLILPPSEGTWSVKLENVYNLSYTQASITAAQIGGAQICDYLQIVNDTITADVIQAVYQDGTYIPTPEQGSGSVVPNTVFLADFIDTLDAGTLTIGGEEITGWAIYRKRSLDSVVKHVANVPIATSAILDYGCASQQGPYTYSVYPIGESIYLTGAFTADPVDPVFWNWSVIECTKTDAKHYEVVNEYVFRNNVTSGGISNNNNPFVTQNFTRFPTVQIAHTNYQSGTLVGLLGQTGFVSYVVQTGDTTASIAERFGTTVDQIMTYNDISQKHPLAQGMTIKVMLPNGYTQYFDDIALRNAVWNLSITENNLFLKNRKGDLIEIRPSAPIVMTTQDNTREQIQSVSLPWVQIGIVDDLYIIGKA